MSRLNSRQRKAVEEIIREKEITRKTYTEICNCSEATAKRDLQILVSKRIIERKGKGRAAYYTIK